MTILCFLFIVSTCTVYDNRFADLRGNNNYDGC